jgi:hypothetical protein
MNHLSLSLVIISEIDDKREERGRYANRTIVLQWVGPNQRSRYIHASCALLVCQTQNASMVKSNTRAEIPRTHLPYRSLFPVPLARVSLYCTCTTTSCSSSSQRLRRGGVLQWTLASTGEALAITLTDGCSGRRPTRRGQHAASSIMAVRRACCWMDAPNRPSEILYTVCCSFKID